jgi:hypothetical protein
VISDENRRIMYRKMLDAIEFQDRLDRADTPPDPVDDEESEDE